LLTYNTHNQFMQSLIVQSQQAATAQQNMTEFDILDQLLEIKTAKNYSILQ